MEPKYKKILLKISGEALAGDSKHGIDFEAAEKICKEVKKCLELGVQIAIVVGAGNFWRGRSSGSMNKVRADHMGMMGTVMNAIALSDIFEQIGVKAVVQTSIPLPITETYVCEKSVEHLNSGKIIIFGYGTGNPFFSTDTAASLRAVEIGADIIFKATNTDGVYDMDPNKFSEAKKYSEISLSDVLSKNLKVMDSTAASMCRDNNMPLLVFNIKNPSNIEKALYSNEIGTLVK